MPKIGYSANGFGKFCEVYEAVEASFEAADAVGGLVDAVEAARGRIDGDSRVLARGNAYVYRVVHLVAEYSLLTSNLKFRHSMNFFY